MPATADRQPELPFTDARDRIDRALDSGIRLVVTEDRRPFDADLDRQRDRPWAEAARRAATPAAEDIAITGAAALRGFRLEDVEAESRQLLRQLKREVPGTVVQLISPDMLMADVLARDAGPTRAFAEHHKLGLRHLKAFGDEPTMAGVASPLFIPDPHRDRYVLQLAPSFVSPAVNGDGGVSGRLWRRQLPTDLAADWLRFVNEHEIAHMGSRAARALDNRRVFVPPAERSPWEVHREELLADGFASIRSVLRRGDGRLADEIAVFRSQRLDRFQDAGHWTGYALPAFVAVGHELRRQGVTPDNAEPALLVRRCAIIVKEAGMDEATFTTFRNHVKTPLAQVGPSGDPRIDRWTDQARRDLVRAREPHRGEGLADLAWQQATLAANPGRARLIAGAVAVTRVDELNAALGARLERGPEPTQAMLDRAADQAMRAVHDYGHGIARHAARADERQVGERVANLARSAFSWHDRRRGDGPLERGNSLHHGAHALKRLAEGLDGAGERGLAVRLLEMRHTFSQAALVLDRGRTRVGREAEERVLGG